MAVTKARRRTGSAGRRARGDRLIAIGLVASVTVLLGAGAGIVLNLRGGSAPAGSDTTGAVPAAQPELAETGEVSAMGMPVVETPGYASGTASVGGVSVQGADWELGRVPLDVAVRPFWTLTNTGPETVLLGEPEAMIRAGCCPGPFTLGANRLAPGDSTVLTFELGMHEGMDGWHDMGVVVPVSDPNDQDWLELQLNVTGDFRD
ncbi:MAG TPA: hypothetical protein VE669_05325 [Actinomycetota bacterium]|nr:hypothetical protein [Actinomycetota bacterium]